MTTSRLTLRSLVFGSLRSRLNEPELLDNLESAYSQVTATIDNLELVNIYLSGLRQLCRKLIFDPARKASVRNKPLIIADLGCGGGDLARWLSRECSKRKIAHRIIGIDHDERVLEIARKRSEGNQHISFVNSTIDGSLCFHVEPDWIVSNHFLHHLLAEDARHILTRSAEEATVGVIANDLYRSRFSLIAFALLCAIVRPKGYTRYDGLLSIRRSLTKQELCAIAPDGFRAKIVRGGIGHQALVIYR